jgi:hypothetical protein
MLIHSRKTYSFLDSSKYPLGLFASQSTQNDYIYYRVVLSLNYPVTYQSTDQKAFMCMCRQFQLSVLKYRVASTHFSRYLVHVWNAPALSYRLHNSQLLTPEFFTLVNAASCKTASATRCSQLTCIAISI